MTWRRRLGLPAVAIPTDVLQEAVEDVAEDITSSPAPDNALAKLPLDSLRRMVRDALHLPSHRPPVTAAIATASGEVWLRSAESSDTVIVWYALRRGDTNATAAASRGSGLVPARRRHEYPRLGLSHATTTVRPRCSAAGWFLPDRPAADWPSIPGFGAPPGIGAEPVRERIGPDRGDVCPWAARCAWRCQPPLQVLKSARFRAFSALQRRFVGK